MAKKTITLVATEGSSRVEIRETFDGATGWQAIAYQFYKFLVAQGYRLEHKDVGAEVSDYVDSIDESEEW